MIELQVFDKLIHEAQKISGDIGAAYYPNQNMLIFFEDLGRGPVIVHKIDLTQAGNLIQDPCEQHLPQIRNGHRALRTMSSKDYNEIVKDPLKLGKKLTH